jgi:hypothetical protein
MNKIFINKGIRSAFKRVEIISDKLLHIIVRGHWCDTVVLNLNAPTEDKSSEVKESFH